MLGTVEFIALFIGVGIVFVEWKIGAAYFATVLGLIVADYTWSLIPNTNVYDVYGLGIFMLVIAFFYKLAYYER